MRTGLAEWGDGILKLKYCSNDDTWLLYNVHNLNLHTHCKHKRVALTIKSDIEHHRMPKTRNLKTLESYARVTTNKRYLRQLESIIEEVKALTNQDRENYCKDCKRSIYGEYKNCDVNIENNGRYVMADDVCGCKVKSTEN